MGAGTQSGPRSGVSDMLGVIAEGGETPDSAAEVGVFSIAEYTGGREQVIPLLGQDTMAVYTHSEPPMLLQLSVSLRRILPIVYVLPHYLPR